VPSFAPTLPAYGGPCLTGIVPALLGPRGTDELPTWFPEPVRGARQVVVLVLDGLGWGQLEAARASLATLGSMAGGPITSVVPSTTATALTSITTGLPPGEHGVIGYRMVMRGEVLNVLRWSTAAGDARMRLPPRRVQPVPAFLGAAVPVVSRIELTESGFTEAHLLGARHCGYRSASGLAVEVRRLLAAGERLVYAYYDGVDKVAHEYGLGEHHRAELVAADRLVGDVVDALPPGAALLVTADHGQVDVGDRVLGLGSDLQGLVRQLSGEGRFRWLHAVPGAQDELRAAATERFGDVAWVVGADEVIEGGWFGPCSPMIRARMGDVALVAAEPVAFEDPADRGPFQLVSRHGSLTADEMDVPLVAVAR